MDTEGIHGAEVREWHVALEGAQKGPLTLAELKELASEGRLSASSLVWRKGMAEWQPVSQVTELGQIDIKCVPPPIASQPPSTKPYPSQSSESPQPETASTGTQQFWSQAWRFLNSGFGASHQNCCSHQFPGLTKTDAIKYIIQFSHLNGCTIKEIKEAEGLVILTKSDVMWGTSTFSITCGEEGNATTISATIEKVMTGNFAKNRILKDFFEKLTSAILSFHHGISANPMAQSDQKPINGNAAFLQGMNQGCGCLAAGILLLFLLGLLGSLAG